MGLPQAANDDPITTRADDIAHMISGVYPDDLGAQAHLLKAVMHNLGMAGAIFTQNDCDENCELDVIERDLEDHLVQRGNEFIADAIAQRN